MHRVRKLIHIDVAKDKGLSGKGIGVGVLDSGVFPHNDLKDRIVLYKDFTKESLHILKDDTGHGTHVCGIIAGNGKESQEKYCGIAPKCHLCVGRILDKNGEGDVAMLIAGVEWLLSVAKEKNIKIINISVSSLFFSKAKEKERLFFLFKKAYESDILIVTAAGNSGPVGKTVSKLGDSPYVICVGCHEGAESNLFEKRCQDCSGRGPGDYVYRKPDIVAPGTDIVSCYGRKQYIKKSGTSMATPIVSGCLALAYEKYPSMSAQEMKRKLLFSADDLGESYLMQGFGMINAAKLLQTKV
jgi:serine protease AprX